MPVRCYLDDNTNYTSGCLIFKNVDSQAAWRELMVTQRHLVQCAGFGGLTNLCLTYFTLIHSCMLYKCSLRPVDDSIPVHKPFLLIGFTERSTVLIFCAVQLCALNRFAHFLPTSPPVSQLGLRNKCKHT